MKKRATFGIWLGVIGWALSAGSVGAGPGGVDWPEMSAAEEQISLSRALMESENPGAFLDRIPTVREALNALGNSMPPNTVKDPFSIKLIQKDILKQSAALGTKEEISHERGLDELHKLMEELTETVGDLITPHGPNDGIVAALESPDGKIVCYAEVVLHDDKGDLECRLFADPRGEEPFDIPISSSLTARFIHPDQRTADLQVRDTTMNEDENGTANIRGELTNYFIYPGNSGEDQKWLAGSDFTGWTSVSFSNRGTAHSSDIFRLIPHTRIGHDPHSCRFHHH